MPGAFFRGLRQGNAEPPPGSSGETMSSRIAAIAVFATAVFLSVGAHAEGDTGSSPAPGPNDVLNRPAMPSAIAAKKLLVAMARAGDSYVAVGPRGHIVVSADGGTTWTQARVPVSSDLTAVWFTNATRGWAVGHDGVVLTTGDGGASWEKQFDGVAANQVVLKDIEVKAAANPESEELQHLLTEAQRNVEMGADKPFLDVWFENETTGFVVGAYNLIFHTVDGGKTWESWFDRVPNPQFMSLYSVRPAAGEVYVSGEQGTFFQLDREQQRFVARPVQYQGTLFGVVDAGSALLTYGIKGNVFRSTDGGKTWATSDSKLAATVVGGATLGPDDVVLADQGGRVVRSRDGGLTFEPVALPQTRPATSIIDAGGGRLGITGPFGVAIVAMGAAPAP